MPSSPIDLIIPIHEVPLYISHLDAHLHPYIAQAVNGSELEIKRYRILKKSIDARNKKQIKILYKILLNPEPILDPLDFPFPTSSVNKEVVVVGAGPAGLLAAYTLARAGLKPLLLERGKDVTRRNEDIAQLHAKKKIDFNSNYLFGEGGAGTYSDGKLYTRIKDPRCDFILNLFAEMGAPYEITYLQRPHIGSDYLTEMVKNLRNEIIALGGEIRWDSHCTQLHMDDKNRCRSISLSSGEKIPLSHLLLAQGHSAYDLLEHLLELQVAHVLKPFQIGSRIEHPQDFINRMQYGTAERHRLLPVPEYSLLSRAEAQELYNVTSFCMCPGGEIIPSTQFDDRLSTNGMSCYERHAPFANSAMIATLEPKDFSSSEKALHFLAHLEKNAAFRGGGNLSAPAQDLRAFVNETKGLSFADKTSYDFGLTPARLDLIHPQKVKKSLQYAFRYFDRLAPDFIRFGKIIGVETRVSSPIRFLRDEETLASISHPNIYIAGEGGGCAGGIISAAVDGMRCAESICRAP